MREEVISIDILLPEANTLVEDQIEGILWEMEVPGFERHDQDTFSHLVDDPRPLPPGATRWRVNLEPVHTLEEEQARFEQALEDFPELKLEAWMRDVTGFRTEWMKFFQPTRISENVMIHPPWDKPDLGLQAMVEIDPGMAFGTGTHETTQLVLQMMDTMIAPVRGTVLDVGMGSGILSIAAIKLGAEKAVGIDIDELATIEATRNAEVNGVQESCSFRTGELGAYDPMGDLVIANILPHILIAISEELIAHTKPEATLILSGILAIEEAKVVKHFEQEGMRHTHRLAKNDWVALAFEHA